MTEEKYRLCSVLISSLGAIGVVVTLAVGFVKYSGNIEKSYKNPFWQSQMETCSEATEAAAKIAMAAGVKEIPDQLLDNLFSIFYGTGQLYLDNETIDAVGDIGSQAVQCNAGNLEESKCIQPLFNALSMNVGQACRDMLTASWSLPLETLDSEHLKPDLSE
ncbi:hypothetical protein [Thioalkalivibrio sp. ALE20]|uniref:hypothetical protein n=1 Tax=Thioalkalivibrio sp. ALE20 TaxID=545275 RepID=UPI0012EA47C3|nr:hypothetical protein [Thioalkalivibrio sp. ALE20]